MKSIVAITAMLALSACAAPNSETDFLCGAQDGQPCRTMSQVDGQAPAPTTGSGGVSQGSVALAASSPGEKIRVPEQIGRLWVAPHLDGSGILHEGANVQFVVRPAQWVSK